MTIHYVEQGTPEWLELRRGKLTGSNAHTIATNGKGLETYCFEIVAEKYAKIAKENYMNEHMQRGKELENVARSLYELQTDEQIEQVGFIEMDEHVGVSPDGLCEDYGGIEIKCHANKEHFRLLLGEEIDIKYWWQIQMNLLVSGRQWWKYVAFNPNYEQELIIREIEPDPDAFAKLKIGITNGKELIQEIEKQYGRHSTQQSSR